MLLGITGPSGSGKTTVANYIGEKFDLGVIHGDEVAHDVLTLDRYNEVLSWVGLPKETLVDRKRLGSILFQDKALNDRYNAYLYGFMREEIRRIMEEDTHKSFIIDWNFLPISELFNECDLKILMKCNRSIRESRVMKRDNIDEEYFKRRDESGISYDNESDYDIVLVNEDFKCLSEKINSSLRYYL